MTHLVLSTKKTIRRKQNINAEKKLDLRNMYGSAPQEIKLEHKDFEIPKRTSLSIVLDGWGKK